MLVEMIAASDLEYRGRKHVVVLGGRIADREARLTGIREILHTVVPVVLVMLI